MAYMYLRFVQDVCIMSGGFVQVVYASYIYTVLFKAHISYWAVLLALPDYISRATAVAWESVVIVVRKTRFLEENLLER